MEVSIPTVIRRPTKEQEAIPKSEDVLQYVRGAEDPAQRNEMRGIWDAPLDSEPAALLFRNVIVESMKQSGLRPEPIAFDEAERAAGLYPDLADPEFASKLIRKKEFAQLSSKASSEDTCARIQDEFETTAIQRLVARFLHPTTPYRSLLLNHGVGVGKTCSAITVAESYLEALPGNTVYIIAPQAIAEGFKATIFDVEKLVPTSREERALTGELWKSPQCTGMTYLRLTDMASHASKEEIDKEVQKLIKKRYTIMGYRAFSNMLKNKFNAIPKEVKGEARTDRELSILMDMFCDHLVIVDEAHNLRDSSADAVLARAATAAAVPSPEEEVDTADKVYDADESDGAEESDRGTAGPLAEEDVADKTEKAEKAVLARDLIDARELTPLLIRMASVAEGMRLLLMTATPMYNSAPEIIFLLNLLHLNDTNDDKSPLRLSNSEFDKKAGEFTAAGKSKLIKLIQRYVSYMRGENPNTFPLRLTPPESWGATLLRSTAGAVTPGPLVKAAYPTQAISRGAASASASIALSDADAEILGALPLMVHVADGDSKVGEVMEKIVTEYRTAEGQTAEFVLEKTIQIANITYPNGYYGNKGWPSYWRKSSATARSTEYTQYSWIGKEAVADVMKGAGLKRHAPKIASIVDHLTRAERGVSFVFSRYIPAGILPIAMALELAGWCRVLKDGTPAPLLKGNPSKTGPFYILLTSNEGLAPDFQGLLKYATTDNAEGNKVRAILGSQITSEGLDLKCVRQLHILDGWYHLNRIEQVEGRGVRFCSHKSLPLADRNCLIYLHAVHHPAFETGDFHAYRIAAGKALPIGRITRLIKLHAWDCMLNRAAIMLEGLGNRRVTPVLGAPIEAYELKDHAFTSFCDFSQECEYRCSATPVPASEVGHNESTYKEFDFRYQFLKLQEQLVKLFTEVPAGSRAPPDVAVPLTVIQKGIYKNIPWSIAATGLREVLGSLRIRRPDGLYGTLVLKGDYVVFQPEDVTDTEIPLTYRYGRAYQFLPRTMVPSRHSILAALAAAAPVKGAEGTKVAAEAVDEDALASAALTSLSEWAALVKDQLTQVADGPLAKPERFINDVEFNGWRWLLYHFRAVSETVPMACQWWMDSKWTRAERTAVLKRWYRTPPTGEAAVFFHLLERDTYKGEVRGFLDVSEGELRTFCTGDGIELSDNCAAYKSRIDAALAPPIKRKLTAGEKGTMGHVYGMMMLEGSGAVFKTVELGGSLKGASCANVPNAAPSLARIQKIHALIRSTFQKEGSADEVALLDCLLGDKDVKPPKEQEEASKARKAAVADRYRAGKKRSELTLTEIYDLTKTQWCPYIEFMLRLMDAIDSKRGGRRWFLSLVETMRSDIK